MIRARATDFESFRAEGRRLLDAGVRPEDVVWDDPLQPSLFGAVELPRKDEGGGTATTRVPAAFVEKAKLACDHADPRRFAVLYGLLWKLAHGARGVLEDPLDPDSARLTAMLRELREEEHHMHAFVRFRKTHDADGAEHWVAWYRPAHDVLRRVAPFFARRYPDMRWSIVTPTASAHWNGTELRFAEGAPEGREPAGDELDALFLTYYSSVFNPARTNVPLLHKHIPARIRTQLPEASVMTDLARGSSTRVATLTAPRASITTALLPEKRDLPSLAHAVCECRACPIGASATQAVFGEGPRDARLVIVGEQPGDEEDLRGRPFVGPAGRLLDEMMDRAALDRAQVYMTNAVKHFKWEPRGKRRIHSRPTVHEVDACRGWLLAEIEAVKPSMILCLGATAAQSFCGPKFRVQRDRGKPMATPWAPWFMATFHPSALLRAPDEAARREMERLLLEDLAAARDQLRAVA